MTNFTIHFSVTNFIRNSSACETNTATRHVWPLCYLFGFILSKMFVGRNETVTKQALTC